jgi:acyl-coenzyme A thioesterase PaaI-like protein
MNNKILNRDLLPGNTCFGCGHENPGGLQIEIRRDPEKVDQLIGTFNPTHRTTGFPGIIHGGAIFTALDCMAFWTLTILRKEVKAFWILRSANIRYLRPAHDGTPLHLVSYIINEGERGDPADVHAEARDTDGNLLAMGQFTVVPLSPVKFQEVTNIEEIPENWKTLLHLQE